MFGKEAEEKLMHCVREVQGLISDGQSPTDAVIKIARDQRLDNDMLSLVVQALNNGRQAYQREKCSGQSVLCKLAEFPLASVEAVRSAVYPDKTAARSAVLKQAAVSDEYSRPPVPPQHYTPPSRPLIKAASVLESAPVIEREPKTALRKADGQLQRIKRALEEGRRGSQAAYDVCLTRLGQVSNYFKQAEYNRLPLAEVEYNAIQLYGEPARRVFDYVATRNRTKEARSNGSTPRLARPVYAHQAPYSLVKLAIEAGDALLEARHNALEFEKEAQATFNTDLRPFLEGAQDRPPTSALTPSQSPHSMLAKEAGFFGSLIGGAGAASAMNMMHSTVKPVDKLLSDTQEEITDPKHVDELRAIESKAMLNDLLANDEVIKGYHPDEVSEAFNEIGKLNPSATNQPAIMRPLLRQRLSQGTLAPFEAQQVADLEKTMRQTDTMSFNDQGGRSGAISQGSPAIR